MWLARRMRGSLCCDRGVAGALCLFGVVVAAGGRLVGVRSVARIGLAGHVFVVYGCVVLVLSPALRLAGFVAVALCAPPDGLFVLLSGVLGHWWSVAVVWWCMAPPHGGAWCVGVWPPARWGMVWCFVAPRMVGHGVVVFGPPLGGALRGGVWCSAWCGVVWWGVARFGWGVVWRCVAPLMVARAALCCDVPHCGVLCCVPWCVGLWPPSWWGVLRCSVAPRMVGRAALGCVSCVVRRCVLWWCVAPLMVGRGVVVCGPPHGGAMLCCAVSRRVAACCVVLCCIVWCGGGVFCAQCVGAQCVALCGVVLCVVVCDSPYAGACRVGLSPPSWWGCVALCCVVWRCVGCAVWRFAVCGAGVWSLSWWGVLRWCVAPLMVGRPALGCGVLCF